MSDEKKIEPTSKASAVENSEKIPTAGLSNEQQISPIFKLTIDCCDEVFEYLALEDLHSLGQTCKRMQQVTGKYFKQNYVSAENVLEKDETYIVSDEIGVTPYQPSYAPPDDDEVQLATTNFIPFITYLSKYWGYRKSLNYIQTHANKFTSINHIYLIGFEFAQNRVEIIQCILNKIEIVQLRCCQGFGDLYDNFLKFCENMKRLYIQRSDLGEFVAGVGVDYTDHNRWLLRNYPKLEHLELVPELSIKIDELGAFFENNPNVKRFSTIIQCIWTNREAFLKSKAKLDILEVKIFHYYFLDNRENSNDHIEKILNPIRKLFDELFEHGFYKRLFLYVSDVEDEHASKFITSLKGLEKMCIREFSQMFDLPQLISLKELAIFEGANAEDMEIFANSYTNIQRLHVCNASIDHILPFIRRTPNLNKIKVFAKDEDSFNGGILPLLTLNEERKKVVGGRKITIYVPDNIFLKTKWATKSGNIDLKLIEMKRVHSIEWNQHF